MGAALTRRPRRPTWRRRSPKYSDISASRPPPGNRNARSAFDALAAIGYRDEARELFVNIVTRRNSFGLLTQDMPGGMPSGMKVSTRER